MRFDHESIFDHFHFSPRWEHSQFLLPPPLLDPPFHSSFGPSIEHRRLRTSSSLSYLLGVKDVEKCAPYTFPISITKMTSAAIDPSHLQIDACALRGMNSSSPRTSRCEFVFGLWSSVRFYFIFLNHRRII